MDNGWRGQTPVGFRIGASVSGGGGGSAVSNSSGESWHPSIVYLGVLIVVEMFVFAFMARLLSR